MSESGSDVYIWSDGKALNAYVAQSLESQEETPAGIPRSPHELAGTTTLWVSRREAIEVLSQWVAAGVGVPQTVFDRLYDELLTLGDEVNSDGG